VPPWISRSLDEELVPHLLAIRVVQAKPIFILCVFLFFCFSVRKFVILLMLNGVFFRPPILCFQKFGDFFFLLAIFKILVIFIFISF
jgi:hypothetical protein